MDINTSDEVMASHYDVKLTSGLWDHKHDMETLERLQKSFPQENLIDEHADCDFTRAEDLLEKLGLRCMIGHYKNTYCYYCEESNVEGDLISGHFGILWGHAVCVANACLGRELILSPNKHKERPRNLTGLADRIYRKSGGLPRKERVVALPVAEQSKAYQEAADREHAELSSTPPNKKERFQWVGSIDPAVDLAKPTLHRMPCNNRVLFDRPNKSNPPRVGDELDINVSVGDHVGVKKLSTRTTNPPWDCEHFNPQQIMRLVIPMDMRPNHGSMNEDGLGMETLKELIEKVWRKLRDDKFSHYKAAQRELPVCPVHTHLELCMTTTQDPWTRTLWWICRGE